jgi:hypothetical protein
VLRRVAATLRDARRQYDTAARYGGEEFALVLPGLAPEDAMVIGERVREAIATNGCDVTASLGLATFPDDAGTSDALVAAADSALYESKHGGRNRVTQWGRGTSAPPVEEEVLVTVEPALAPVEPAPEAAPPVQTVRRRPRAPGWTFRGR